MRLPIDFLVSFMAVISIKQAVKRKVFSFNRLYVFALLRLLET
jgi:hypothetical protein